MTNLVPTHTRRWGPKASVFVAGMTTVAALVTGCQAGSPRGELADNQRILATCDPAAPPASLVEIDGTVSSASEAITTERMTAIESIVRRTAICSGHLRVSVFSASSAATTTLFDGPLRLDGATDNARLKRSGLGAIVNFIPTSMRDATNVVLFRFDDFSPVKFLSSLILQSYGIQPRLNSLTLRVSPSMPISELVGNCSKVDAASITEKLRRRFIQCFD